jgi:hypothetical protein
MGTVRLVVSIIRAFVLPFSARQPGGSTGQFQTRSWHILEQNRCICHIQAVRRSGLSWAESQSPRTADRTPRREQQTCTAASETHREHGRCR